MIAPSPLFLLLWLFFFLNSVVKLNLWFPKHAETEFTQSILFLVEILPIL